VAAGTRRTLIPHRSAILVVSLWAVLTFWMLQIRVYPRVGDGDCGSIWSNILPGSSQVGCNAWPAFMACLALTTSLVIGPLVLLRIARWGLRRHSPAPLPGSAGATAGVPPL
jgi:hypothetical protein